MTDLNKTIEYVFKLSNDVSAQAKQIEQSVSSADQATTSFSTSLDSVSARTDEVEASAESLKQTMSDTARDVKSSADEMTKAMDQLSLVTQLSAITGMTAGINAVSSAMINLGLVTDEQAEKLQTMTAAFSALTGVIQIVKSLQTVMTTLNATEAVGTAITAMRTAISNPMGIALVGAGLGAGATVAGLLLTSSGSSTTNNYTTINVDSGTPASMTSEVYQIVAGGAL